MKAEAHRKKKKTKKSGGTVQKEHNEIPLKSMKAAGV